MNNNKQVQEDHLKEDSVLGFKDFQDLKVSMISLKGDRKEVAKIHLEIYSKSLKSSLQVMGLIRKEEVVEGKQKERDKI